MLLLTPIQPGVFSVGKEHSQRQAYCRVWEPQEVKEAAETITLPIKKKKSIKCSKSNEKLTVLELRKVYSSNTKWKQIFQIVFLPKY